MNSEFNNLKHQHVKTLILHINSIICIFQQIMQLTLNLDFSITTYSRSAANRHAKKRKKKRQRQTFNIKSVFVFVFAFIFAFVFIFASIEINAFYECHSMTVTFQTSMKFRKFHYTINDRNEMILNKQKSEIYSIIQSTIIQNSLIETRFMFDVAFDVSKIDKHTRFQVKSQQKLLQKNQKIWKNQIFKYWWQLKRAEIIKINEKLFSKLKYRLTRFLNVLLKNHCRFQIWIKRHVWNEYVHCKWKKHYFFLFIVVRINDEKKIRLHMKKKIVKHNNRFFFKSLTKYVCNAMQKKRWKFDFSHNISIFEKVQFAKNIKRVKETKEKINAKTTKKKTFSLIKRIEWFWWIERYIYDKRIDRFWHMFWRRRESAMKRIDRIKNRNRRAQMKAKKKSLFEYVMIDIIFTKFFSDRIDFH